MGYGLGLIGSRFSRLIPRPGDDEIPLDRQSGVEPQSGTRLLPRSDVVSAPPAPAPVRLVPRDAAPVDDSAQGFERGYGLPPRGEVVAPPEAPPRLTPRNAIDPSYGGGLLTPHEAALAEGPIDPSGGMLTSGEHDAMRLVPRSALPPPATQSVSADAGPHADATPPGLMPRSSMPPPSYGAPRPPLRAYSGGLRSI